MTQPTLWLIILVGALLLLWLQDYDWRLWGTVVWLRLVAWWYRLLALAYLSAARLLWWAAFLLMGRRL